MKVGLMREHLKQKTFRKEHKKKQTESLGCETKEKWAQHAHDKKKWKAGKSDGVSMCSLIAEIEGLFIEP